MKEVKYYIDSHFNQPYPQTVQNMARFLSIEGDYILLADLFKSFQVFSPKTQAELELQRVAESRISLKMRFHSKMDSGCMAVYVGEVLDSAD